MKLLSIVIVTWNCKKYIQECLDSLAVYRQDPRAEIIIVDNVSEDGTPELIKEKYPEVTLIESGENLGFPRGTNLGIRHCTGKYLFLINPDVRVLDGCIEKMLAYLQEHPEIGLLGPKMLDWNCVPQRSYMGAPTLWNLFCRALALDTLLPKSVIFGGHLMEYMDQTHTTDVDILNGWFWATHREAVEEVGVLDDQLFMYADDLDWSKRFLNAGWRVVYFPEAEGIHYGGGTTARAPVRFALEMQRADYQYWQKYHSKPSQLCYLGIVFLHQILRLIGYGVLACVRASMREDALFKMKRSVACLQWVLGFGKHGKQKAQATIEPEVLVGERP